MVTAPLAGAAPTTRHQPLFAAVSRRSPWVAAALDADRARDRVARALPDAGVDDVRIGSVLYRPDGGCTLRYQVGAAGPGPTRTLLVDVPGTRSDVVIRSFPDDPGLPTLPAAVDPVRMREVLGRVVPGTGGVRAIGRCRVDVVHHPRRDRCVLRYRLSPGSGGTGELRHPVLFGKVYRDGGRAAAGAAALRLLRGGTPVLANGLRLALPRPLAVVSELRLGLAEAVPGRALVPELLQRACGDERLRRDVGASELMQAVRTAGQVIAAVHGCPAPSSALPWRSPAGERTAVEEELGSVAEVWPDVASLLHQGLSRPGLAGRDCEAPPVVLAHGDWTPAQVLLDESGGAALVDVDTLCLADPALDLGRFLAYLHVAGVRRSRRAWPLLADLSATFLQAYLDAVPRPPAGPAERQLRERTTAYRALALARMGARASWQLKEDRLAAVLDVLHAGDRRTRGGIG